MFRTSRPGTCLATALMLAFPGAAQCADYLLESQEMLATASPPAGNENGAPYDALNPSLAIAPEDFRAVVVWSADDASLVVGNTTDGLPLRLADDEQEILAAFVSPFTAETATAQIRISTMGNDDEESAAARALYDAFDPVVKWNPVSREFLVVWSGDDDTAPLVDDEFEIFAQRMSLEGELLGKRLRVSVMGDDSETSTDVRQRFGAANPALAVDPETGRYLVTWQGDDDTGALVNNELEIFGRLLDSRAQPVGGQFRISASGDEATTDAAERAEFDATDPATIFNPVSGKFVVAWQADDDRNGMVNGEHEIFAVEVDGDGQVGSVARISSAGPDGDNAFDALEPSLAVEPESGAMLVAWHGDTGVAPTVDNELEIYARMLDAALVPLGSALRVSSMGTDSESSAAARSALDATSAAASWSASASQFLVAWRGDTTNGTMVDNEHEIFARFLDVGGNPVTGEFRVSFLGEDDDIDDTEREYFDAAEPVIEESMGAFIVAWSGDTYGLGHGNNWIQLFARRVAESSVPLELEVTGSLEQVTAPDPVTIEFKVTNKGSATAENVRVDVHLDNEFPYHWEGCDGTGAGGECRLGPLEGGESATVTFVMTTDHLELGDEQSTNAEIYLVSDTAIRDTSKAIMTAFIPVTISVEGGNGAFGLPLLVLLAALPWFVARRRGR